MDPGNQTLGEARARAARAGCANSMINDQEIWACANQLLKQHGHDAWFVASQRADELLEKGDMAGSRTFQRILNRIRQLELLEPTGVRH